MNKVGFIGMGETQMLKRLFIMLFLLVPFQHANAQGCYEDSIKKPVPFHGNSGEVFQLFDGSIWEVGAGQYNYLYEYYPSVIICPDRGLLIIDGESIDVYKISGGETNPPSSDARISPNLNIYIPSASIESSSGTIKIWLELEFKGQDSDGDIVWKLKGYGLNQ